MYSSLDKAKKILRILFIFITSLGKPQTQKKETIMVTAKQFAVLHVQKGSSSGGGGLGAHIDRHNIPTNADPEKQDLNEHLINSAHSMNEDIKARIKDVGCKVRSNSVKNLQFILSGSHDRMKEIEKDPKLYRTWVNDNRQFLENEYGKENIIRFSVHRDERTPHIHCVITPITEDGRLTAREILGDRKKMSKLQEDYGNAMKKFGLNRGLKGSKAKHYEVSEYYARIKDPISAKISIPEKKFLEKHENYIEKVKSGLEPLILKNLKLEKEIQGFKSHVEDIDWMDKHVKQEQKEIENIKKKLEQELRLAESEKRNWKGKSEKLDDKAMSIGREHGQEELLRVMNNTLKSKGAKFTVELTADGRVTFPNTPTVEKKPEIKPRKNQNRISRGGGRGIG